MQNDDIRWFLNNYVKLYKQYGKAFLAIKDAKVLGHYKTPMDAFNKTIKKEEGGTFIVMECKNKKPPQVKQIAVNNIAIGQ